MTQKKIKIGEKGDITQTKRGRIYNHKLMYIFILI